MAYCKDDLKLTTNCRDMLCIADGSFCSRLNGEHFVGDARRKDDLKDSLRVGFYGAYLPHSCQEWFIGGPDEIRALIADLNEALVQLKVKSMEKKKES